MRDSSGEMMALTRSMGESNMINGGLGDSRLVEYALSTACSTPIHLDTHLWSSEWALAYVCSTCLRATPICCSNVEGDSTNKISGSGVG